MVPNTNNVQHILSKPVPKILNHVLVNVLNVAIRFQEFPLTVVNCPPIYNIFPIVVNA